jgi:stage II sporulation protein D
VKPDVPAAEDASSSIKLRALVAAALLVTILLVVLQATPPFEAPPKPSGGQSLLTEEPDVRVRIASLEPGQELAVTGIAGRGPSVKIANKGGAPEIDGEPCEAPCSLAPAKDGGIGVGERRYHGSLVVVRDPGAAKVHVVNRLPIERYLEGVVLSEMPPDYPDEALLAQSIASRSYAAWQLVARKDRDWDVTDTQRSQVYRGSPKEIALARRIVGATRGQVLLFEDRVLEAVFSSTCGGATRSASEAFGDDAPAPLRGVPCGLCDGTQFSTWSARAKRADAGKTLGLGGPLTALVDAAWHPSGRLAAIVAQGGPTTRKLAPNQFRDLFGPAGRSTWFTKIELSGDFVAVEGRGFGHGAGMCQVGASKLAAAGRSCRAILSRYYPDSRVGWLYPVDES